MIEEWDLASINLDRIKKHDYEVAVPTLMCGPKNNLFCSIFEFFS